MPSNEMYDGLDERTRNEIALDEARKKIAELERRVTLERKRANHNHRAWLELKSKLALADRLAEAVAGFDKAAGPFSYLKHTLAAYRSDSPPQGENHLTCSFIGDKFYKHSKGCTDPGATDARPFLPQGEADFTFEDHMREAARLLPNAKARDLIAEWDAAREAEGGG